MDSRSELLALAETVAQHADNEVNGIGGSGDPTVALVYETRALRLTIAAAVTQRDNGDDVPGYEGWADVELMGHRSRIGYVRETRLAGRKMVEIQSLQWFDPADETTPRFLDLGTIEVYSASAVFSLTPITQDEATRIVRQRDDIPF